MLNKPYIFIGCSKEGQQIANMLQVLLQEDTYSFLENQCIGEPMYNRLELINSHLEKSDFGVIVFTKSDIEQNNNDILFLLGLLKGELGKDRFMVLLPKDMSTSVITSYLKGAEPGRYDDEHPDLGGSLGTTAFAIKEALKKMEKRKTEAYYFQLESKKELLKEALDSYNCSKDRYNPFLSSLMGYFNTEIDQFSFPQVLGATLFAYQKDELVQVGSSGKVKSDHRISLAEEDKFVVQCYKQKTMVLGEKKDRYNDEDEESFEYIFCNAIHQEAVLTVHIKCKKNVGKEVETKVLQELEKKNAGYISILRLLLKGGVVIENEARKNEAG